MADLRHLRFGDLDAGPRKAGVDRNAGVRPADRLLCALPKHGRHPLHGLSGPVIDLRHECKVARCRQAATLALPIFLLAKSIALKASFAFGDPIGRKKSA